ncbi:EamA family transporter [Photobacterium sp. WH77]|uniref:EamA family transporter n=1 Tax=Photobacterium arenosum TaxID=2774143 RepID=A0ABR9BPC8_9GAMM|nr:MULTISPECIES: EamA family transporter [Photobacterium]MBD8514103.1 EamA family transporter [Photobacterium arenosum]MBV7264474.1 EamA family transporter [Photobacterium sp. WH24]MCG2839034.1 EamA family transporter [Photobacterium sp. WH77]MCG2846614.1 EamA family transporter [Photobacterium sp. WH80]
MKSRDMVLALLVVVIWGVNFSVIKIGLETLPPILFSALRFAVVAVPAVFFIPFPKTSVWNVLGVGVFLGVLKFGLLFIAMKADASAGLSSLILQAQVFFTIGLSVLLYKEMVSRYQALGILVAVAGFGLFFLEADGNITAMGLVMILAAAFCWAIANTIMKRMQGVNLLHFMVWVSLVPPLPLLLISYFTETAQPLDVLLAATSDTWLALLYVSYISTLLAFALWGHLLKSYPAATVTPFALLIPVVGMFTSTLVLNERMTETEMAGAGLIFLGLTCCILGGRLMQAKIRAARQQA